MGELRQGWFDVRAVSPGIVLFEEPLHSENVKSYLVMGTERAALIDTGMGVANLRREVEAVTALPVVVLQSHAHFDHVGDAWRFDDVRVHATEAAALERGRSAETLTGWLDEKELRGPLPDGFDPATYHLKGKAPTSLLSDGDQIDLGGRTLTVLHCPGHSPGSLAFLDKAARLLISTDVAYLRELYALNPDSSVNDYLVSLRRVEAMIPDLDLLLPAHGPTPIVPSHLAIMADGMQQVVDGREPDETTDGTGRYAGIDKYHFGETSILVGRTNPFVG